LNSSFEDYAYQDKAFPISANQTISQPYTVAYQTQLLEVRKDHKILEIGTGSGYQTAILCMMGAKVYSIERQTELFKQTAALLPKLGIRPKHLSFGDGYKGLPNHAPFDGIIVTAGAPIIPQALMAQLKIGGKLVIPLGEENQIMTVLIRKNETQFEKQECGEFKFVPLLENKS
jgi:protein-L-isoaspartate(D-aspartate) O-methyltransferase